MPRISHAGPSNWVPEDPGQARGDESAREEKNRLAREARAAAKEEGESPSAGTSSSTSGSKQGQSGTTSTTGLQSPAHTTDSPSSKDLLKNPESSTVPLTDGSGQETTSARQNRLDSSEDFPAGEPAIADPETSATKSSKRSK